MGNKPIFHVFNRSWIDEIIVQLNRISVDYTNSLCILYRPK